LLFNNSLDNLFEVELDMELTYSQVKKMRIVQE